LLVVLVSVVSTQNGRTRPQYDVTLREAVGSSSVQDATGDLSGLDTDTLKVLLTEQRNKNKFLRDRLALCESRQEEPTRPALTQPNKMTDQTSPVSHPLEVKEPQDEPKTTQVFIDPLAATGEELIAAVKAQDPGPVRDLIRKGANVNYTQIVDGYFNGWTPVMYAAQSNSVPILKALIDAGADVNAKSISDGSTALHAASQRASNTTVIPLLEAGADPAIINDYSQTPFHFAAQVEDGQSINAMLEYSTSVINHTDTQGYAPIHYAAQLINPAALNFLIDVWADVELKTTHGNTPLHLAARKSLGEPDSVESLIEVGARLDEQDLHGNTALHYASEQKTAAISRALLLGGAQWNAKNAIGQTALHRAVEYGHIPIINLLATSCVAVTVKDVMGFDPIYYARHRKSPAITRILESKCNKRRATTPA